MSPRRGERLIARGHPRGVPVAIATGRAELRDEPDGSTTVLVNNVPSSSLHREPERLDFEYMRHLAAAVAAWPPPDEFLAVHIGGAACTFPRYLVHRYPRSRHLVIEVDGALASLAREWMELPRAPQLRIRVGDGLDVLRTRPDGSADLLVRDAFYHDETPAHLADSAWWEEARRVTRPGGMTIANCVTRPRTSATLHDARAARASFAEVCAVGEPAAIAGRRVGNVVIVAGDSIDLDALRRYAASAPLPTTVRPKFGE